MLGSYVFVTILVLLLIIASWLGKPRTVVLWVPACLESIRPLAGLVSELARQAKLGEQAVYCYRLAIDEACANIIEHAYANSPHGEIKVVIQADDGVCKVRLTDFGEPYDPSQIPQPQKTASIEEVRPGGLGLHLIHHVMDEVHYTPSPFGNSLVMIKRR